MPPTIENKKDERWHGFDAAGYRNGMDYDLFGFKPTETNHWRWTKENAVDAINNYKKWLRDYSKKMTLTNTGRKQIQNSDSLDGTLKQENQSIYSRLNT